MAQERAGPALGPHRRRADHRRRHHGLRHAARARRLAQRPRGVAGLRRDQGPGAGEDRPLRADRTIDPAHFFPTLDEAVAAYLRQTGAAWQEPRGRRVTTTDADGSPAVAPARSGGCAGGSASPPCSSSSWSAPPVGRAAGGPGLAGGHGGRRVVRRVAARGSPRLPAGIARSRCWSSSRSSWPARAYSCSSLGWRSPRYRPQRRARPAPGLGAIAAEARAPGAARRADHEPVVRWREGGAVRLVELCRQRGIEPIVLHTGADLLALAEDAVARGADVIGMAGGDGSQALVASVASRHGIPFVVVPAGTRNHFALDLGMDRADVVGALDALRGRRRPAVDLAEVNGRVFVNNASMGLYAKIVQSEDYRDAKVQTAAAMLPDLIGPAAAPLDLRFALPSGEEADGQPGAGVEQPLPALAPARRGHPHRLDSGGLGLASVLVAGWAMPRSSPRWRPPGRSGGSRGGTSGPRPSSRSTRRGRSRSASTVRPSPSSRRCASSSGREPSPCGCRVRAPARSPAARTVRVMTSGPTVAALWRTALGRRSGPG